MPDLAKILRSGRVLLMDGAMGTEIQRAGIRESECYEAWNVAHPQKIRAIHTSYVEAGADVLLANTFGANPTALSRHQQEDNLPAIIKKGVVLARSALSRPGWVLADFGPVGTMALNEMLPILEASRDVDGLLLETIGDPAEAEALVRANRSGLGKPILVSFTFDGETLRTFRDMTPEQCAQAASEMRVDALGVNCGRELDMAACAEIIGRYRVVTTLPLFARPNAGTPTGKKYPRSPDEMAAGVQKLLEAGAAMVGGCCGTTPQHIRAFRRVVETWNDRTKSRRRPR
jgi:5-methyltetrahydrofolate--homocysteine methyltransferase